MTYSFNDILGNEQIKKTLARSVMENRLSHAYIFEGAAGSGKSLLANSFARLIFCRTKKAGCACHSCVQFDAGSHSDLIYAGLSEKSKSIGVSQIRETVISELNKKPFEYEHKIFIIDNAELLTPEAQNALLRSIEEPPSYAVFMLLAKSLNFLPTVLSRCFIYKMKPFGNKYIYDHMKSLGLPEDICAAAGAYSCGSVGRAEALCGDVDFLDMRERVNKLLADESCDLTTLFDVLRGVEEFNDPDGFITIALMWFRDVLVYKASENSKVILQTDYAELVMACARRLSYKSLYQNIGGLIEMKRSLSANLSFGAVLDAFAIKLNNNANI